MYVLSEGVHVLAVWKPKTLNVSQLGSNLHVVFEQAPPSFGFHLYYLYYKLRQDGPFRLQRCKPVSTVNFGEIQTLPDAAVRKELSDMVAKYLG